MGRMYVIPVDGTAFTAAIDAFEIKSTSGVGFILHELCIAQSSDIDSEQIAVAIKRATGAYTSGSGGSAPTPAKMNNGSAAASVTAEVMNTSQAAAGSGALTTLLPDAFNVLSGWHYLPTPECRPVFGASEACVVSLTAPADSLTLRGYAVIEETP